MKVTDVDHSILLALSKLDGIAAEWAGPYRDNFLKDTEDRDKSLWWSTWEKFTDSFEARFGLMDDEADAEHRLERLCDRAHPQRNARSIRFYIQDFNRLQQRTGFSDNDKVYRFIAGLPDRMKRVLINHAYKKDDIKALQDLVR